MKPAIYYDKALQIYEDVGHEELDDAQTCGKNHKSTLTTLKNLAILYQAHADASGVSSVECPHVQGLDRFEYMMKAEDVLQDIEDRKKSQFSIATCSFSSCLLATCIFQ